MAGGPGFEPRLTESESPLHRIEIKGYFISMSRLCRVRPKATAPPLQAQQNHPRAGNRWPYTSSVIVIDECPRRSCTTLAGSSRPPSARRLMHHDA